MLLFISTRLCCFFGTKMSTWIEGGNEGGVYMWGEKLFQMFQTDTFVCVCVHVRGGGKRFCRCCCLADSLTDDIVSNWWYSSSTDNESEHETMLNVYMLKVGRKREEDEVEMPSEHIHRQRFHSSCLLERISSPVSFSLCLSFKINVWKKAF